MSLERILMESLSDDQEIDATEVGSDQEELVIGDEDFSDYEDADGDLDPFTDDDDESVSELDVLDTEFEGEVDEDSELAGIDGEETDPELDEIEKELQELSEVEELEDKEITGDDDDDECCDDALGEGGLFL